MGGHNRNKSKGGGGGHLQHRSTAAASSIPGSPAAGGGGHRKTVIDRSNHSNASSGGGSASGSGAVDGSSIAAATLQGEAEGVVIPITYKEVACIWIGLVALVVGTFLLAMTAEISIEIHYFDRAELPGVLSSPSSPSSSRFSFSALDARQRELNFHHRVTTVEPDIASIVPPSTSSFSKKTRLQRVVLLNEAGYPQPLIVVEEVGGAPDSDQNATAPASPSNGDTKRIPNPPTTIEPKIRPKPCKGDDLYRTLGFDDWATLSDAIREANSLSVDRFVRWSRFFAEADTNFRGTFDDDSLYYEEDFVVNVCPGTTLRARTGPIFVNAPNVVLSCPGGACVVEVGGSHFSFGPHAKNVLIRGFTFRKAQSSSLVFFETGADVSFEDCAWYNDNKALTDRLGAVADINSTSSVSFYRCHIGNSQPQGGQASALSVRS